MTVTLGRDAVRDTTPAALAVLPFGLLIGVTVGTHPAGIAAGLGSAALFFGGAAHLSALTMITDGAGPAAVLAGVLVVNSRLLLYGAAVAPRFTGQPWWFRWFGPAVLIDQTFALADALPADVDGPRFRRYWLTSGATMAVAWLGSHVAGVLAGPLLPGWLPLGVAAPAVLVGLLVPHLERRGGAVAATVAGAVAAVASPLPAGVGTIVGALAGLLAATALGLGTSGREVSR